MCPLEHLVEECLRELVEVGELGAALRADRICFVEDRCDAVLDLSLRQRNLKVRHELQGDSALSAASRHAKCSGLSDFGRAQEVGQVSRVVFIVWAYDVSMGRALPWLAIYM